MCPCPVFRLVPTFSAASKMIGVRVGLGVAIAACFILRRRSDSGYVLDGYRIPKNSSIIVKRVPGSRKATANIKLAPSSEVLMGGAGGEGGDASASASASGAPSTAEDEAMDRVYLSSAHDATKCVPDSNSAGLVGRYIFLRVRVCAGVARGGTHRDRFEFISVPDEWQKDSVFKGIIAARMQTIAFAHRVLVFAIGGFSLHFIRIWEHSSHCRHLPVSECCLSFSLSVIFACTLLISFPFSFLFLLGLLAISCLANRNDGCHHACR